MVTRHTPLPTPFRTTVMVVPVHIVSSLGFPFSAPTSVLLTFLTISLKFLVNGVKNNDETLYYRNQNKGFGSQTLSPSPRTLKTHWREVVFRIPHCLSPFYSPFSVLFYSRIDLEWEPDLVPVGNPFFSVFHLNKEWTPFLRVTNLGVQSVSDRTSLSLEHPIHQG